MRGRTPQAGEIATLVHTHGTRLTRLAHLLEVRRPQDAAADALAATLLRPFQHRDAHEGLLVAARAVGSRAVPPLRDDARLQGWLDQAELDPYDVDLTMLVGETQQRLLRRQAARRRRALRSAAVVAVGALVVSGGLLWPDAPPAAARRQIEGSGMLYPNDPDLNGGDPNAVVAADQPAPRQRVARDIEVAGVVLRGRTTPIMSTSLPEGAATLLAVPCTPRDAPPATCVVLAPAGRPLRHAGPEAVLALLPAPRRGMPPAALLPTVLRGPTIGTSASQTLLLDVTSPEVAAARVTYSDGSQVLATRYLSSDSTPLFVARNKDVLPTSVAYLDQAGATLQLRSLSAVTS